MPTKIFPAICAFCGAESDVNLSQVPDDALASEWKRRISLRRKVKTGGRQGGKPGRKMPPRKLTVKAEEKH